MHGSGVWRTDHGAPMPLKVFVHKVHVCRESKVLCPRIQQNVWPDVNSVSEHAYNRHILVTSLQWRGNIIKMKLMPFPFENTSRGKACLQRRYMSRQLNAIFVGLKLHQVFNMYETPISRQQIALKIAPGFHLPFGSCNFSATKIALSC